MADAAQANDAVAGATGSPTFPKAAWRSRSARHATLHDRCAVAVTTNASWYSAVHGDMSPRAAGKRQRSLALQAVLLALRTSRIAPRRQRTMAHMLPPRRCRGPKRLFSSQRICVGRRYRAVMLTC
ncbi:hypothetical protein IM53_020230 [Xanthomonas phaseoli pv. dieffenbachiae]|uniref:Uncharacterized protein n=1 Tax=Xanthomonas phaseoli pv. dieffenbachiae TaxID=92828 RepID=A0A1V9GV75_9XANT|nr:hypothetical protein IM53_020230 [Xanthomonas phaseoli pv. dieffenbachiae]